MQNKQLCKFGIGCIYQLSTCKFIHPGTANIPCKQGEACFYFSKNRCLYLHEAPITKFVPAVVEKIEQPKKQIAQCKYKNECTNIKCAFIHQTSDGKSPKCHQDNKIIKPSVFPSVKLPGKQQIAPPVKPAEIFGQQHPVIVGPSLKE